MDLQEQINSLKSENQKYKEFSEKINAEKIALDQMLVENLKSSLSAKTDNILLQEKCKKLENDIVTLNKEKESLENQITKLKCNEDSIPENSP